MNDMWGRVRDELDCWHREKRVAKFWWRDDDATSVSPQLRRMIAVAKAHHVPVGLSVIPAKAKSGLAQFLRDRAEIDVLVHGYAHINHERGARAKREFGVSRLQSEGAAELKLGLEIIGNLFGKRALAVLVPPWNRISPGFVRQLPRLGYYGVSTWKPCANSRPAHGLTQVNTHLDLIDWRRSQRVKTEELVASLVLRKLRSRRAKRLAEIEPLGLLTHHLLWCPDKERIVVNLLNITQHPAACWLAPRTLFGNNE